MLTHIEIIRKSDLDFKNWDSYRYTGRENILHAISKVLNVNDIMWTKEYKNTIHVCMLGGK